MAFAPIARQASPACTPCANCPSRQSAARAFACLVGQITTILSRIPPQSRGTFRPIVTTREAGMRWTRLVRETNASDADGEVVWSWPPDAEAKLAKTLDASRR